MPGTAPALMCAAGRSPSPATHTRSSDSATTARALSRSPAPRRRDRRYGRDAVARRGPGGARRACRYAGDRASARRVRGFDSAGIPRLARGCGCVSAIHARTPRSATTPAGLRSARACAGQDPRCGSGEASPASSGSSAASDRHAGGGCGLPGVFHPAPRRPGSGTIRPSAIAAVVAPRRCSLTPRATRRGAARQMERLAVLGRGPLGLAGEVRPADGA